MFDPHHLSVITFLGSEKKNKATVLFEVVLPARLPVYIKYDWQYANFCICVC
jgi:hypothetical protein